MKTQTYSPVIEQLIEALMSLPGIGAKSAQRMAIFLLEKNRAGAVSIVRALQQALDTVGYCTQCRCLTEGLICRLCLADHRESDRLCIVEYPADLFAIEKTGTFQGRYFVLLGRLSPLDGVGPERLGLPLLTQRLNENQIREVILATNLTVEGEATAHYLHDWLISSWPTLQVSRIAHGVPMGGELEYVDGGTLTQAFLRRRPLFETLPEYEGWGIKNR
jgi:recombination protein RecR